MPMDDEEPVLHSVTLRTIGSVHQTATNKQDVE